MVVPFRDAARWIRPCLRALLAQEMPEGSYEVLAIDNGSRDGSAAIVGEFPGVRLLQEPEVGAYRARNLGVRESSGSILAFTDADCAPLPDWIASLVRALEDSRLEVVLGQRLACSESQVVSLWSLYERAKEERVFSGDALDLYYGHTNDMAVRRSCFERFGPFHERPRGADTIFVRTVVDALGGPAVGFEAGARVRHLELTGPLVLLRKFFIYGRSRASYRNAVAARPLGPVERWETYRYAVRKNRLPASRGALLLGFLVLGVIAWSLGTASGSLTSWRQGRERDGDG